jgi:transposase
VESKEKRQWARAMDYLANSLTSPTLCGIIILTMTSRPSRHDAKADALRAHGALHPRPQAVQAPLFASHDFFDPRDLVQVKYEMLRRVDVDGQPVARTADTFGVSRPTFYQTQAAFTQQGFAGLVPRKRGPHGAHKLDDAVMTFVATLRTEDPALSVRALLLRIHARFGLDVHPRSLERALRRAEKKRR